MRFFEKIKELFIKGEEETPEEARKKTFIKIGITAIFLFVFLYLILTVLSPKPKKKVITQKTATGKEFVTPTGEIDIYKEKWIEESSKRLDSIMKSIQDINTKIASVDRKIADLEEKYKELESNYYSILERSPLPPASPSSPRSAATKETYPPSETTVYPPKKAYVTEEGIKIIKPSNSPNPGNEETPPPPPPGASSQIQSSSQTPSNLFTIPAGAFARAILLAGVDAPTGSQTDAHPVLLQLIDPFILPNFYRGNLQYCFFIGSAYGDLASERAFIRLERMSFVQGENVIDVPVKGWVVDSRDGKYGVKGKVVDKQGKLIAMSLLAGVASGVAKAFQYSGMEIQTTPLGGTIVTVPEGEIAKVAASGGIRTAAEQLAQFYLQKAEKLFPVIEVPAGIPVDVVLQEGVSVNLEGGKYEGSEEFYKFE